MSISLAKSRASAYPTSGPGYREGGVHCRPARASPPVRRAGDMVSARVGALLRRPGRKAAATRVATAPIAPITNARVNPAPAGKDPTTRAPAITANAACTPTAVPVIRIVTITAAAMPLVSAPTLSHDDGVNTREDQPPGDTDRRAACRQRGDAAGR